MFMILCLVSLTRGDGNCTVNATMTYAKDVVFFNQEFTTRAVFTPDVTQCIDILKQDAPKQPLAVVNYTIIANSSNERSVKTLPYLVSYPDNKVSANKSCINSWNITHKRYNNSLADYWDNTWDIFVQNNTDYWDPLIEIMIFLSWTRNITGSNDKIDSNVKFSTWNDIIFDVYFANWGYSWNSYAFIPINGGKNGIWSVSNVDLNEIFWYLRQNGHIADSQYIHLVSVGTEIGNGQGQFTYEYQIDC